MSIESRIDKCDCGSKYHNWGLEDYKKDLVGMEHIHLHSDYSILDGYGQAEEYSERSKELGHKFLCVSDHGMMGVIPRQIKTCEENGLSPIFACELYINPNQPELKPGEKTGENYISGMSETEALAMRKSYHLLAVAYNLQGYKNLVKMSSWGWTKGFYYKPRINRQVMIDHSEGIIATSGCYNSEIGQAFDRGGDDAGFEMIELYHSIYKDNFFLELMLLDFTKQKPYDAFLIRAHEKYGIPIIVTNDVHYCKKEDSQMQRLMLMIRNKKTVADIEKLKQEDQEIFELQDENLWLKSEPEMNEKWFTSYKDTIPYDLFKKGKENTVLICNKAKGVEKKIDRSMKLPQIPDDNEKLKELFWKGFKEKQLPETPEYIKRFEEEYYLITKKGFASYFLLQKMMVDEARRKFSELTGRKFGHEAVGEGRGSAVGALICYCLGITNVDPIKHGLLFSRFLSPARGGRQMKIRFSIDPVSIEDAVQMRREEL